MKGLIFVGMLPPDSHNPEEHRFVEELAARLDRVWYLRGIGVKGLGLHQVMSLRSRLFARNGHRASKGYQTGSLIILPFRNRAMRPVNVAWLRRQLRSLMEDARVEWSFWTRFPSPELVEAIEGFPFARVVYEPIDRYAAAANFSNAERSRIASSEARLIRRAMVITGGRRLAEDFGNAAGGSHWLPFGKDLGRQTIGAGMPATIGRPRLGVVGGLDWRMDERLLFNLAARRPDWHLVLVGPRERPWGKRLQRLRNVHWLGSLPAPQLTAVIADCDVTLIPYRLTDWTRACLPVKVFDYLAEGKTVIATPLPELAPFADVIALVEPDGFPSAVQRALEADEPGARMRRRQAAVRFTLQDRARQAAALLEVPLARAVEH